METETYLSIAALAILFAVVLAYALYDPSKRCAKVGHDWWPKHTKEARKQECERCGAWRVHASAFGMAGDEWIDLDAMIKDALEQEPVQ